MNSNSFGSAALVAAIIALAGCGGSGGQQTTATVGAAGATLKVGTAALTIPAGALASDTAVTLRQTEPHHAGRTTRVEVEPSGTALSKSAMLSVKVDDVNSHVKMLDQDANDDLMQVEIEDRNHHTFKTSMDKLGAIEVEEEHGATCAAACASGEECDDGVCKANAEDDAAATCDPVCDSGLECDDGTCKAHGGGDPTTGTPAVCTPTCATGLECDNGICKPHKV